MNYVSVIKLVLCTGIAVDFVLDIARFFLEHVGTRTERAIKSLETMGPPVVYVDTSKFLAIIVISLADSYVFDVLFQGFLFLILAGFVHGLMHGPIVPSYIGPKSFYVEQEDKDRKERELEERVTKNNRRSRRHTEQHVERCTGIRSRRWSVRALGVKYGVAVFAVLTRKRASSLDIVHSKHSRTCICRHKHSNGQPVAFG